MGVKMLITVICDGWGILHFKPERCDDEVDMES